MIVSNTTPISNLLHIHKISVLIELFGSVYIPEAVAREVDAAFSGHEQWQEYVNGDKLIIQPVSNTILVQQMMPILHQGEAEAICLALEREAKLCLIDDKDARTMAKLNNMSVTGTLGILLKAKKSGLISSVKEMMDKLRDEHHFWINEDMYEKVLGMAMEGT